MQLYRKGIVKFGFKGGVHYSLSIVILEFYIVRYIRGTCPVLSLTLPDIGLPAFLSVTASNVSTLKDEDEDSRLGRCGISYKSSNVC